MDFVEEDVEVNRYVRNGKAGVAMFIAAGNNGVSSQIGTPGSAEDVIVGALDKDTSIVIYSSRATTEEGRIKPNIAFVCSDVMSAEANLGWICRIQYQHGNSRSGRSCCFDVPS